MFSVSPAAPDELLPALRLLLGDGADPERGRAAVTAGDHEPIRVFVARGERGQLRGAVLAEALPGALAVIGPPRGDSPAVEDALAAAALGWLRDRGVKVCQAFAPAAADMAALERAGFRRVTQLVFMRRPVDPGHDRVPSADRLAPAGDHPDFAAALLATHEGTLDCPELNGTRTPEELVAGFGRPGGAVWQFLADPAGRISGLALTEPADDVLQLTYLGVIPAARGRGVGGRVLRRLLADAAGDHFAAVELSVDARNEPALRLYRRHRFAETDRRDVWLANLSGERPA